MISCTNLPHITTPCDLLLGKASFFHKPNASVDPYRQKDVLGGNLPAHLFFEQVAPHLQMEDLLALSCVDKASRTTAVVALNHYEYQHIYSWGEDGEEHWDTPKKFQLSKHVKNLYTRQVVSSDHDGNPVHGVYAHGRKHPRYWDVTPRFLPRWVATHSDTSTLSADRLSLRICDLWDGMSADPSLRDLYRALMSCTSLVISDDPDRSEIPVRIVDGKSFHFHASVLLRPIWYALSYIQMFHILGQKKEKEMVPDEIRSHPIPERDFDIFFDSLILKGVSIDSFVGTSFNIIQDTDLEAAPIPLKTTLQMSPFPDLYPTSRVTSLSLENTRSKVSDLYFFPHLNYLRLVDEPLMFQYDKVLDLTRLPFLEWLDCCDLPFMPSTFAREEADPPTIQFVHRKLAEVERVGNVESMDEIIWMEGYEYDVASFLHFTSNVPLNEVNQDNIHDHEFQTSIPLGTYQSWKDRTDLSIYHNNPLMSGSEMCSSSSSSSSTLSGE